jgi:hypothetical protein
MEAIQGINKLLTNVLNAKTAKASAKSAESPGDFSSTMKAFLAHGQGDKISEEHLFSGLIQKSIQDIKGDAGLAEFKTLFEAAKKRLQKANGYVPVEDATKAALKEYRDANKLTKEEADSIYSKAFAGAQLDQNTDALYDDRGGPNDPTIAVAEMEQALILSSSVMSKFDSGAEQVKARSLDEPSNSAPLIGSGGSTAQTTVQAGSGNAGFLFKPSSESDGKLVVLLPPRLAGLVKSVSLVGPNGEIIETGRYTGNGNEGRDHYRFSRPGAQYQDGLAVQATLTTGEIVRYIINETSQRSENLNPEEPGKSSGESSRAGGNSETENQGL